MASDKRLYRSRDALIGGVCAGIAEYFDIDPIVARILAVVLTLATAGAFAIAYLALWIILPLAPDPTAPVDVKPESVHSETYGSVYYETPAATGQASPHAPAGQAPYGVYPGPAPSYPTSGHVPPEPPTHYGEAHASHQPDSVAHGASAPYVTQTVPPSSTVPIDPPHAASQTPPPGAAPQAVPPTQPVQPVQSPQSAQPAQPASGKSVRAALWFGFICLFIGFSALFGHFIQDVSWWQFWPVLFVIVGIGNVVIPAQKGRRMSQFVSGLMEIAIGVVLLCMSLGIITFSSLVPMVENLWPLLIMMVGFFILSNALRNSLLELVGGVCFVAFCVIGLLWFTTPGPTEYLTVEIPFKETVVIDVNPWDEG